MGSDHHDDDPPDKSRTTESGRSSSLLYQLRSLLEALAEIEEEGQGHRRGSGQIDRRTTRIDYEYDISIGLGSDERRTALQEKPTCDRFQPNESDTPAGDPTQIIHVDTREIDDEHRLVIANLSGVVDEEEEFDVDLNTQKTALAITVGDDIIDWIALDDSNVTITDASLNNQILTIRLDQSKGTNGGHSQ